MISFMKGGFLMCKYIKTDINLVPDTVNTSPDYYCTWQTQLYACCNSGPQGQRDNIDEVVLFNEKYPFGWINFHEKARADLIFVMDDSWDVPYGEQKIGPNYGSLILDKHKFASFYKNSHEPKEAMKALSDAVKAKGWRGVGGWVCAHKATVFDDTDEKTFYEERFRWSDYADWKYWKIDWGYKAADSSYRRMLTEMRTNLAPNLIAEQAINNELIPESDVFRTYDVPALMSIPMTMEKLDAVLRFDAKEGYLALIDCEDEVYIAAALGCSMGVMRHPMTGNLPDGTPDPSFPALHRNIKTKMDEVTRAVRWHRIAPAFAVNGSNTYFDENKLTDTWLIENQASEIEAWWNFRDGDTVEKSGTARISRGMPLPDVTPDKNGLVPFVVCAKNPNGAVSVATLGRTMGREWILPKCELTLDAGDATTIGVFGEYGVLRIKTTSAKDGCRVLMQDLMSDVAFDVTEYVSVNDGTLEIPGNLIHEIGTSENGANDTSEPGLVIKVEN